MAQPANALSRQDIGNLVREDLSDVIRDISPTETPFHSNIGREDATNDAHEWPQDSLPVAKSTNQHIDGDDFSADAITAGNRIGNYCEIGRYDIVVTRRSEITKKAGRRSSLGYQLAKAGRALKRDCESSALANKAARQGQDSGANATGQSAGYPTWIRTNVSRGSGGTPSDMATAGANAAALVNGFPTGAAAVDASNTAAGVNGQRALAEEDILTVLGNIYVAGGDTDTVMMYPTVKQRFSSYMFSPDTTNSGRIATQYQDQGKNPRSGVTAVGAVDVYVSDFGVLDIVPNRFQRSRDVLLFEKDMWAIAYLEGYNLTDIGRTGLSEKRVLSVDWCLEAGEEASSGIIADIDPALPMVFSSTE